MDWLDELTRIRIVALDHGIDWAFIAAIRRAEWGGPGREFGVLSVAAPDYQSQLRVCTKTIRGYLMAAQDIGIHCFDLVETELGVRRLVYSASFIRYTANRYAPLEAENDESGLNANWAGNVTEWYHRLAAGAVPV